MNVDPIHLVGHIRATLARTLGVGALAAVAYAAPKDAMAQSGPSPIPERAFAACESKAKGDACSIYFGEHELKGTCVEAPSDPRLVCRPDEVPAPRQ
jgi:hypothetical protein